jgi:hypothetical protein
MVGDNRGRDYDNAIDASADSHCALQLHSVVGRGRPLHWLALLLGGAGPQGIARPLDSVPLSFAA